MGKGRKGRRKARNASGSPVSEPPLSATVAGVAQDSIVCIVISLRARLPPSPGSRGEVVAFDAGQGRGKESKVLCAGVRPL